MTRIIKVLIIFFIFSGVSIANEAVNKIIINGNQRISDETIKIYGEIDLKNRVIFTKNDLLKKIYFDYFEIIKKNLFNQKSIC